MTRLALFEDDLARHFLPLTWTRPVWALRCGIWTLRAAIEDAYSHQADALWARPLLADVLRERTGLPVNEPTGEGMVLLLNGRLLATRDLPREMPMYGEPRRYLTPDGTLLGAWVDGAALREGLAAVETLPATELEWPTVAWPWELLTHHGARLAQQAERWELGNGVAGRALGVHVLHPERVFVHPTARLQPGVVLDASAGPLVVDAGATILANAVVQGPGYVGLRSTVKIGAKIYHGTSIGPVCKVGGEVEETIFQGHSNKQHDGFLGHAYVGAWCNFGADTNNSDLKNTYRPVSLWADGAFRDTGSLFVGLFAGDHSKTGINTMLNTGTVVGVACNLFGSGFPPRHVPSFSWGGADGLVEHRLARALETAERVMARRDVPLTPAERALLTHVFEGSAAERAAAGVEGGA